jgi:hypothetical protein
LSASPRRNPAGPSRSRGAVFALFAAFGLCLGSGSALAQANGIEEGGVGEKRPEQAVDDKAFDCAAFKQALAAASDGFRPLRGASIQDDETMARFGVTSPLFGACEILDKKKVREVSYSCQAQKVSLADLKATVESCLGELANGLASNENPNTPYLRYSPLVGGVRGRVMVLATFGKQTLVIFNAK